MVAALHDISLAGRYCDRMALLSEGAMVVEGSPIEVLTPEHLRCVFGVEASVNLDPLTGCPQVWLIGPSH